MTGQVEQPVLDIDTPVPARPESRFCARWGDVTQRSEPMPESGSPVEAWAAWYESCGCELCQSVAAELAARQLAGVVTW